MGRFPLPTGTSRALATGFGHRLVQTANQLPGKAIHLGPGPAPDQLANLDRFGNILIIEHAGGWTTLITNMITSSVKVGDPLVAGDPVGRAGAGRPVVTVELRKDGEPQDITALLS